MKLICPLLVCAVALFTTAGCAKKEITPSQRKQAESLVAEAQFAASIKEFPRAENLLAQATALCPDEGAYWLSLGSMRVRQGEKDAARAAYKSALKAFEDAADRDKTHSDPAIQQVVILVLMGRVDDARALQAKLLNRYPNDAAVKAFVDEKRIDQMLADPQFKQFAL